MTRHARVATLVRRCTTITPSPYSVSTTRLERLDEPASITARGDPTITHGGGGPTPAAVAPRIRASQRLKAVARSRCGARRLAILARAAGAPSRPVTPYDVRRRKPAPAQRLHQEDRIAHLSEDRGRVPPEG